MSLATNIVRRGATYYARVAVPLDLRPIVGKREVWKSLRTTDPAKARALAPRVIMELKAKWNLVVAKKGLDPADIEAAIWERYTTLIEADERFRYELPTEAQLDEMWRDLEKEFGEFDFQAWTVFRDILYAFDIERERRRKRLATLREHVARGETASVQDILQRVLEARQLQPKADGDEIRLAVGLQRAEIEALHRAAERDKGDFAGEPQDKIVRPPSKSRKAAVPASETILGVWDRYKREREGSLSSDTWIQNRKVIELLADFAGRDEHVSVLTRRLIRDWKDQLFLWPLKAGDTGAFRGLTFQEVIAANRSLKKPTISPRTINRYLSAVGGFARYLLSNDYIEHDIMSGMFLELDRSEQKVFPYSPEQLQAIFASPLFAGCEGDKREHVPGKVKIRDWRYWIPWIALYSGARLGEIAQLHVADIRQIHGHWCFHITEVGGAGKTVKTRGSERVVPIHSELIKIGLLKYHAAMMQRGETRLFPEIKPDARGFISGSISSFFNDYFRRIGVKSDRTQNFHSFRHGIADAFRNAGFMDEQFGVLLGHTKASTTQRYGVVPQGDLKTRIAMINRVWISSLHDSL